MKAVWNNTIIAESNNTIIVEGNHYFPPESVKRNISNQVTIIRPAHGKEKQVTIMLWSMEIKMKMLLGIIRNQKKQQEILLAIWRFGMGYKLLSNM